MYTYHQDPGHGWVEVPRKLIEDLDIAMDISHYSYVSEDGYRVFLEEDCDLSLFVEAFKAKFQGNAPELRDLYDDEDSWIRDLERYQAPEPVNLDAMDRTDLHIFWEKHSGPLGRYAMAKASAMLHRESGRIDRALEYEGECDEIYQSLPKHERW